MFLKIYYVHRGFYDVRGIAFLAVDGCSGVFSGVCRGLVFGVFGEVSSFCGILRLHICDSVWSGLLTLIFDVVDGGFFLE